MPLTYGYFDSVDGDRKYDADTMSRYFSGIISRGVLQTYGGGFQATATETTSENGLPVSLQTGKAYFTNGKWVVNNYVHNVTLGQAANVLPRIDRIVLRCDTTHDERNVSIMVKEGVPDAEPTPPELMSTEAIEEMSLCQVYVDAGATAITQDKITDERPDDSVCGFVHQLFDQVNTEELFNQYDTAFEEWFKGIKETVATTTLIRQYTRPDKHTY